MDADSPDASVLAKAVRARAEEVARSWLAGASGAYGQAKRLIRSQPSRSFAAQLAEEARTIAEAFDTEEARTRVAAFARASEHKTRREPTQEGPR